MGDRMKFLNPKFLKMRTSVLLKTLIKNVTSVICFACVYCAAKGQTTEFVFHNSSLESGTAGADGAVYRFPLVTPQLDALVKITGRSSSSYVKLASIDLTNTGFERSFQPQVSFTYDSSYSTGSEWMEFQITFVQQNTVAPSAIATFSASALDIDDAKPNALLNWSTSQEHNFNYFLIERSIDGENFSQVALVFGAGESDRKIDYSYNDKDLKSRGGVIYYRLKQVDIDGKFSYSSVRIIRLVDEKTSVTLTTYPNPVANDLRITLPFSWQNKHVHIDLYNLSGQLVTAQDIGNSSQTESIALASLQKGIYFVQVRNGDEIAQQRIVKN
jgi:type IX secretion system substrate protein